MDLQTRKLNLIEYLVSITDGKIIKNEPDITSRDHDHASCRRHGYGGIVGSQIKTERK
jgi:hypothetical protein